MEAIVCDRDLLSAEVAAERIQDLVGDLPGGIIPIEQIYRALGLGPEVTQHTPQLAPTIRRVMIRLGWQAERVRQPGVAARDNRTRAWRRGDSGQWWIYRHPDRFVAAGDVEALDGDPAEG
jgi:hypothetical protein